MLVIVGPSASGKSEVVNNLIKHFGMHKLVTCTTRAMRQSEVNDRDYHFLTIQEFKAKIDNDEFVEWQIYNNNYYGSLKREVTPSAAVILEPVGYFEYKKKMDDIYGVFLNIDANIRFERMLKRGDGEQKAHERIMIDEEVFNKKIIDQFDLVIDDFSLSVDEITKLIYDHYEGRCK